MLGGIRGRKGRKQLRKGGTFAVRAAAVKTDVPVVCFNRHLCQLCIANELFVLKNPQFFVSHINL